MGQNSLTIMKQSVLWHCLWRMQPTANAFAFASKSCNNTSKLNGDTPLWKHPRLRHTYGFVLLRQKNALPSGIGRIFSFGGARSAIFNWSPPSARRREWIAQSNTFRTCSSWVQVKATLSQVKCLFFRYHLGFPQTLVDCLRFYRSTCRHYSRLKRKSYSHSSTGYFGEYNHIIVSS